MQSSSLSTYIGYITGPRAEQPVGVRVVEPPPGTRQFQRGSLYIVVEVAGDHPDRGAIVDRLLSEVQRVYYSAKGSQSQVMVEAVQQTQQLLREINAHTPHYPMQLGITCAALLGGRLLVASSGPAFALMRVSERVHMFPSEPTMTVPAMAGGYGQVPIEVYRQDVQADDAMFLGGGGWLRRVPTRTLASIVAFTNAENCADAADELYDQAGQMQVPGLLIVFGTGSSEPPHSGGYGGGYSGGGGSYLGGPSSGAPSGGASRPPASRRPRFGGLPTTLNTAPPARLPPSTPLPALQRSARTATSPSGGTPSGVAPGAPPGRTTRTWEEPPAPSPTVPAPAAPPASEPLPTVNRRVTETPAATSRFPDVLEPVSSEPVTPESALSESALSESARSGPEPTTEPPRAATPPLAESSTAAPVRDDPDVVSPAMSGDEAAGVAATNYPYPVSPLEEESFGGDLPVEPGDEFDPIFPPSTTLEAVERLAPRQSWLDQWQAQAGQRLAQARGFFGRMLPDRREHDGPTEWQEISDTLIEPPQKPVRPRYNELAVEPVSHSLREQSVVAAGDDRDDRVDDFDASEADVDARLAPVIDVSPLTMPAPTRGARARLFLLISAVILILVPAVVVAINFGQGNTRRAEAEQLTARAEIVLLGAQSALDQGDKVTARDRLTEAQEYLAQAIERDGTNEHRAQLIATIQAELQEVLQIMPLYGLTEPLITFPPDARPQHVLVMNDDIFVIDSGRQALLQYRFDPATATVTDQQGQVILSQGEQVGGVTVGTLADLAWLPLIPGFEDRPNLLISDRNNNVFRYDQRVEGATLLPLADRNTWGSIGQIQAYNGRVYIADEAQDTILRYTVGRFEEGGEPWFAPGVAANLAGLVSMEIDGDIWLLLSNGAIMRYREREQLPFSPENSMSLAEEPTDMYVTRKDSAYIYVVDAGEDRILVYDKSGAYIAQLQAPEDDLLRGLTGLYIDEVSGTMYILTQTGLFSHPVLP